MREEQRHRVGLAGDGRGEQLDGARRLPEPLEAQLGGAIARGERQLAGGAVRLHRCS